MLGTDATCFGSEISTVDPAQKTLELKTTNVSLIPNFFTILMSRWLS